MYCVGQEVVCFKEEDPNVYYCCALPKLNCLYTIRAIDGNGVWLQEIRNATCLCENSTDGSESIDEPNFDINNFRPVQKTDISVFTNMLKERELVE